MAGLPPNDFDLFTRQVDGTDDISDHEENPTLPASRSLFLSEDSSTPEVESLRGLECVTTGLGEDAQFLLIRIDALFIRIDELLVLIRELLVRIDEHIRAARKIDSGYSSCMNSPRGEKRKMVEHDEDTTVPRKCLGRLACSVCPGLKQDCYFGC
jgi:hypothetical protein